MKIVNSHEMKRIDRLTIESYGVPSLVLMERAGLAVAAKVKELFPPQLHQKVTVVAGRGNNGGDGLVVARILQNWGYRVKVLILAEKDALSLDCAAQYQITRHFGIKVEFTPTISNIDLHGAVIIDAIFGTGINKPVNEDLLKIFNQINSSSTSVVSVDMPSGISSDTGEVLGGAIKADYTVTFGLPKRGHFLYPGASYTGSLFVDDIGFDSRILQSEDLKVNLIQKEIISGIMTCRQKYSHKGDYGHVLIIAGSRGKTGAALLSAKACLRSGSGLVTLGVPESLIDVIQGRITEEMTLPLEDSSKGALSSKAIDEILSFASGRIDAIAIGPGIGVSDDTEKLIARLVKNSPVPLVIDADGINSLSANPDILLKAKSAVIITPHPGEMARFYSSAFKQEYKISDVERNRLEVSTKLATEYNINVVLKGVPSVIASPKGDVFINSTGNPGMATAGAGDVLTGIIASLVGQGLSPLNASVSGVYIHGLSGDIASAKKGQHCMLASDIIDCLSDAFNSILHCHRD